VATLAIILGSILLVGSSVGLVTEVYGQSSSFDRTTVFVVDNVGVFVHDLNLKATESEDGKVDTVSDFEIDPEDVVQVRQGGNIMVFTGAEEDKIDKVKVTSTEGITTELVGVKNSYSVQVLATGVYTLNVIVDTGNEREGFETILVVLGVNESPVNPITIVNNFENVIKTRTIIEFEDDDDDDDGNNNNGNNTKPKPDPINNTKQPIVCPINTTNNGGKCVPISEDCEEGSIRNADGRCVGSLTDPVVDGEVIEEEEEEQNSEVIEEEEPEGEEEVGAEEEVEEESESSTEAGEEVEPSN
jgi:hypothetical protein